MSEWRIGCLVKSPACLLLMLIIAMPYALAEEVAVAVASNFLKPLETLKTLFEKTGQHTLIISGGASGQFYAQIKNGAPYDVFLSADEERPRRLEEEGVAVPGSRYTYAIGKLAVWSATPDRIKNDGAAALAAGHYRALAMANPELAPYGKAAQQTLQHLQLLEKVRDRIVLGENIGQTYTMIHTGNAELGFIALSQLLESGDTIPGSFWEVPDSMHAPILQQVVLLKRAEKNPSALAFLAFLRSTEAQEVIARFGYALE